MTGRNRQRTKIFFDGGLRPLPAGMETAVVVRGVAHVARGVGAGTSVEAEWMAAIAAVRHAAELGLADVLLLGDCRTVIDQANGAPCRGRYAAYLSMFRESAGEMRVRVRYVKRAQNLAGIELARE